MPHPKYILPYRNRILENLLDNNDITNSVQLLEGLKIIISNEYDRYKLEEIMPAEIISKILNHQYFDKTVLDYITKSYYFKFFDKATLLKILENKNCDFLILTQLSQHPNTTPDIMAEILQKEYCDDYVLGQLSQHPNTTPVKL